MEAHGECATMYFNNIDPDLTVQALGCDWLPQIYPRKTIKWNAAEHCRGTKEEHSPDPLISRYDRGHDDSIRQLETGPYMGVMRC